MYVSMNVCMYGIFVPLVYYLFPLIDKQIHETKVSVIRASAMLTVVLLYTLQYHEVMTSSF